VPAYQLLYSASWHLPIEDMDRDLLLLNCRQLGGNKYVYLEGKHDWLKKMYKIIPTLNMCIKLYTCKRGIQDAGIL
jgi:predicted phosphohydrolase